MSITNNSSVFQRLDAARKVFVDRSLETSRGALASTGKAITAATAKVTEFAKVYFQRVKEFTAPLLKQAGKNIQSGMQQIRTFVQAHPQELKILGAAFGALVVGYYTIGYIREGYQKG